MKYNFFSYWYSINGHEVINVCLAPWSVSQFEYDPCVCYTSICAGVQPKIMEFSVFLSVTCNTQIETPYLSYLTIHNRIRTPTNVMDLMKRKVNMLWIWHYSICWFKENFALSIRLFKFQMNEVSIRYCEGDWNPDIMPDFEKFFLSQKATSEGICAIIKEGVAISGKTLNSIRN